MQPLPSLNRGRALSTSTLVPRGGKFPTCQIRHTSRSAFTLVELLVVIAIIAILAALVTPAVMQAQVAARNAAIKVEIDMLHMAMMQYKNEYGSFPPAISTTGTNDLAASHIRRIFPRSTNPSTEAASIVVLSGSFTPLNSLVGWLNGYNSNYPEQPVTGGTREKLYDFDKSRLDNTGLIYFPSGKPQAPYIYISGSMLRSGTSDWPSVVVPYTVGSSSTSYSIAPSTYAPVIQTGTTPFNFTTFQILCAGRDEKWGTDDDLSNFWPRTRKEYLDSLK